MEDLAKKMPQGFSYSWTGLSLEELAAGGTSLILFGLGTLVVYLTLSAQYESFVLPFIVLLAVPMALLGALGAQWLRGLAERRVLPGRTGHAGRTVEQERDSDRGIRRAVARARSAAGGIGDSGGDDSAAADSDDFAGVHSWRGAAGGCHRRRREWAAFGGHDRIRRDDHVDVLESVLHSGAVPDY